MKRRNLFRFVIVLSALGMFSLAARAQQLPQFSQYLINDYVLNPAIGGSRSYFEAKTNHRYQWISEIIKDAPRTYIFSVNGPIYKRMGAGGYVFTDITGPTRRAGGQLSYAYHFNISDQIKLSLGASLGVLQFAIDGAKITAKEVGDIAISSGVQSVTVADAAAGFYLYSDKWFFSASAPQLFRNNVQFFSEYKNNLSRLVNHYFVMGGYRYDLNETFSITPSFLVKYVSPVPVQIEPTLRMTYKEQVWIAGSYRTNDAITATVGYIFQQNITFGYSYDMSMTNLKNYSSGTHEVMLGIRFKGQKKPAAPSTIETTTPAVSE